MDGVQESKSSSVSEDVYSVSFAGCRTVYPIKIVRPINKFKLDDQAQIKSVLDDINKNECQLENCICDNPKRSIFRCALSAGASFACEYCESKAEYYTEPGKRRGHLVWPYSSTANGPLRTIVKIMTIVDEIESGREMTRDECKGFYGCSHLLHQPNFNLIQNLPAEYMHSGCLGAVKRMLELTFNIGENRERTTNRKLSEVSEFNAKIASILVCRESSRRIRHLDFGVMKAQEFRNIILHYFHIVADCIQDGFQKEKKIWFQLAYIMRACTISNKEFYKINDEVIINTGLSFYKNFQAVYDKKNCTYSIHLIGTHINVIRGKDPLTARSAFKFENFYSEMKNLFQPGTRATSKQILENTFMKRCLENHNCEKSIFFDTEKKRGRENNSLIYYIENGDYKFFNIINKIDENNFMCIPQGKFPYRNELVKELKWEKVGVFKVGPYSTDEILVKREKIEGKVLKVNDLFLTCPNNVLREQ